MITDYPQGDGLPDCPHCLGRGVIAVPPPAMTPPKQILLWERTQPCACVFVRDVARNVERGWRGLLAAPPIAKSVLMDKVTKKLHVTAPSKVFRSHMKHIASRMPPAWGFLVISDADLMDAWLSRKLDVFDADVVQKRQQADVRKYEALVDLVEPPELLVIICGVKTARNEAMPEVLLEAIRHRELRGQITWVVDQPGYPLIDGHISYSHALADVMGEWENIKLTKQAVATKLDAVPPPQGFQLQKIKVSPVLQEESIPLDDSLFENISTGPRSMLQGTVSCLDDDDGNEIQGKSKKKTWKGGSKR